MRYDGHLLCAAQGKMGPWGLKGVLGVNGPPVRMQVDEVIIQFHQ